MRVSALHLADFRSYQQAQVDFEPGVTTLVGRNGQGKTNLVEAIRYVSTLSSHRVASDAPLIRAGEQAAVIQVHVEKSGRTLAVEVTLRSPGAANQARIGRSPAKPRDVVGILRTVIFSPEDLDIVKGDPGARRRLLDELCVSLQPPIMGDLADYDRVLRQRVSMLKTAKLARGDLTTLDIWDEKLAELGGRIIAARLRAIEQLRPWVQRAYADVAPGQSQIDIMYAASFELPATSLPDAAAIGEALLEALRAKRQQEIDRGVTLSGPHRDDLTITLGELPAKGYASHGESWSCALALRLGTYDLLTHDDGPDADPDGEPVLILDDVFAELDQGRRAALAERLAHASQVLITAAVAEDVPASLLGAILTVADGAITKVPA
jgi:DNA replication and repair protein RecF